jgi:type II restriction enzyme
MITKSQSIRQRTEQHKEKNTLSKKQERVMIKSINKTVNWLQKSYPNYEIGWQKSLPLHQIYKILQTQYDIKLDFEKVKGSTFISPDGGFVWVKLKGIKYFLLVGEEKHQGTNDKRLKEGKNRQAIGNAVERLGKNYNGLDLLFKKEKILPFVTFLQGCDFHESETISDRVITIFKGLCKNKINLYKDELGRAGTYFIRGHKWDVGNYGESDWTENEMFDIFKIVSEQSLEYYIKKYE